MAASEKAILLASALLFGPLMWRGSLGLALASRVVLTLLAVVDAIGLVYLQTANAKRKYHRAENASMEPRFVVRTIVEAVVQLVLFDALVIFPATHAAVSLVVVPCVVASIVALSKVPLPLQRPLAMLLFFACYVFYLGIAGSATPKGMQWFVPMVLCKYLVSMMVRAEPYVGNISKKSH